MLAIGTEAVVRVRLDSGIAGGANRLYARAPLVQLDTHIDPAAFRAYLERMAYRRVDRGVVGSGQYHVDGDEWIIGRRGLQLGSYQVPGGRLKIDLGHDDRVTFLEDSLGQPL